MKKYSVGWGLTNICNMNCQFCYSKIARDKNQELSLSDWIKFIDLNHDNIESINYGTGENTLIDDFFIFIDYVRTNYPEITQSLTTNGHLYEKIQSNSKYYESYLRSIDEVDVSLDFADKSKHTQFRGQPKAYDWAINTLKMLQQDHKKATIVFVGFDETLEKENITGLFKIALEYDAYLRLNIYRPTSCNEEINKRFILSEDKLYDALDFINENYRILSLNDSLLGNLYTDELVSDNTGVSSIRILPNGMICPSTYLISDEYLSDYSILDGKILDNLEFPQFEAPPLPKECDNCLIKDKCKGGVLDRRYLWYGSLEERDPYCPTRSSKDLPKQKYKIYKKERISVHDGYLPTLFFENREDK